MEEIIKISGLSFSYRQNTVLKNVRFSANAGDFIAITGANGAGKSTFFNLLLGNLKADSGEIFIKGIPLKNFKDFSSIVYLSQLKNFNEGFPATVEEIVSTGLMGKKHCENKKEEIESALEKVNMTEYKKRLIGNLSGGQQQRVMIAKALVADAEIMLLDEPSAGLDSSTIAELYRLLKDINVKRNITILMITHDLEKVQHYASRFYCIEHTDMMEVAPDQIKHELQHKHRHIHR